MAATIIRLETELKLQSAAIAAQTEPMTHPFIVDAVACTVEQIKLDEALGRIAEVRWSSLVETGRSVACDDAKRWLKAKAQGDQPKRPAARIPHA